MNKFYVLKQDTDWFMITDENIDDRLWISKYIPAFTTRKQTEQFIISLWQHPIDFDKYCNLTYESIDQESKEILDSDSLYHLSFNNDPETIRKIVKLQKEGLLKNIWLDQNLALFYKIDIQKIMTIKNISLVKN